MRSGIWRLALMIALSASVAAQESAADKPPPFEAVCAAADATGEFSWAPDSARLAFAVRGPDRNNLRILAIDSMQVRNLDIGDMYGEPIWSPSDERIAVLVLDRVSNSLFRDLYIVSAEGDAPIRKIASGLSFYAAPEWSADGSTLLATTPDGSIVLIDPDNGSSTRVADGLPVDDDNRTPLQPIWIDASHIAFMQEKTVYLLDLGTHVRTPLPMPAAAMLSLRPGASGEFWYIDRQGPKAVLTALRDGRASAISNVDGLKFDGPNQDGLMLLWGFPTSMVDVGNGVTTTLWPNPPDDVTYRNEYRATWSPDGRRFAFGRIEGGPRGDQTNRLCVGLPVSGQ